MQPATPPPAKKPPGTFVTVWGGLIVLCLASELLLGLVDLLVYRDTGSYTLAGNPWDASSFPWCVIWEMRLLTILAGLVGGPVLLFVAALPIRLLLGRWLGAAALQKPAVSVLSYGLAVLLVLLLVARIMGWWGLGAVPAR